MILHRLVQFAVLCMIIIPNLQQCDSGFDYASAPEIPFNIEHTELNLTIQPSSNSVKGVATYTIQAKAPERTSVLLHASELAIESVTVNGKDTEFSIEGDSLLITLVDTLHVGEQATLAVTWQTRSKFGVHQDYLGTVWGSLNPKALRHWLPIFDHPRIETLLDAKITIPADMDVVFNGRYLKDEIVSPEQKMVHWQSKTALPVTGLSFAVGKFTHEELISGTKKIHLFAEESIINAEQFNTLLKEAVSTKKVIENTLSFEYPFESLNIVVLENSFWEEKQSGAGLIYLYNDLGDLSTQLKRGMYDQWFGQYQRTESFMANIEKMELMKTALHFSVGNGMELIDNPDSLFSILYWNGLQESYLNGDDFYQNTIKKSLPKLITSGQGVVDADKYEKYWYKQTGLNWYTVPTLEIKDTNGDAKQQPIYLVNAEYDETASKLTLSFDAISGDVSTLSGLTLNVYTLSDTVHKEVAFTGKKDAASFEIPLNIEYVTLSSGVTDISQIELGNFPIMFLLNQLRSADVGERVAAAQQLEYHLDQPDLQLALGDALSSEKNVQVKAKLLETFGSFTNGATGTEQTFLKELNNTNEDIQVAVAKTLGNYLNNEVVNSSLRSLILKTEYESVFNQALLSYQTIASLSDLISLTKRLQQTDSTGQKAVDALQLVMDVDTSEVGIEIAEELIRSNLPYQTRKQAFSFILKHQQSEKYWQINLPEFLEDADPRIRQQAIHATVYLNKKAADEVYKLITFKEYDPRVLQTMKEIRKLN